MRHFGLVWWCTVGLEFVLWPKKGWKTLQYVNVGLMVLLNLALNIKSMYVSPGYKI